jgi:putative transposase
LANLGYKVCDQTVGNVLQRHGLPPAPERKRTTTWSAFIRIHLALLVGTDFFTTEVLTLRGLVTYYVLFFIHLESRRVDIAGITVHPDERWMRAESSGEEQCSAVPSESKHPPRRACSMPRATGRPVALLPSGGSVTACPTNEGTD